MKLVIATFNRGKAAEITALLEGTGIDILALDAFPDMPEVVEDGATFMDNALMKARATAVFTGLPALADDSGLVVDALCGLPGVMSARYASTPEECNAKLLAVMADVPDGSRSARFVCALALVSPGGFEWTVEESCVGRIAREPAGSEGFGYDPVFFYEPLGKTFAQLPREVKNTISHRWKALAAFRRAVEEGMMEKIMR